MVGQDVPAFATTRWKTAQAKHTHRRDAKLMHGTMEVWCQLETWSQEYRSTMPQQWGHRYCEDLLHYRTIGRCADNFEHGQGYPTGAFSSRRSTPPGTYMSTGGTTWRKSIWQYSGHIIIEQWVQRRACVARWHDATWIRAVGNMVAWHSFAWHSFAKHWRPGPGAARYDARTM